MYHRFLIHSLADGHLGCFQHLAIVNYTATNIGVHRFFRIDVSGFLGYNPSSVITAVPFLVFWGNSILFSTVAAPVCIPTNGALGFPFLHNLTSTCLLICLCRSSDWCEVVSHCGFNLHVSGYILLACLFCWLVSTYRGDHMIYVFHLLAYFT